MKKLLLVFSACVLCLGCGEAPLTEFKSPDGKFTVLFPGTPKASEQTGKIGVKVKSYEVASSSGSFLINHYDSPVPIPNDQAIQDKVLPLEAEGLVTGLGGKAGATNVIKLQDKYQGVEYSSDVTKPKTGKLRGRTYIVDQRVYNVIVLGREDAVNSDRASKFFDSFKVSPWSARGALIRENPMLDLDTYLIKEHVGLLKLADTYDIFDPQTNEQIAVAKEEFGALTQIFRFLMSKRTLPTSVVVYEHGSNRRVFSIERGFTFFRSHVDIKDAEGTRVGYFKSKFLTIGGGFWVYDDHDQQVAEVKGDWVGWNFKFLTRDGEELGTVAKKWAGLAKELFTSADNYVIALNENVRAKENGTMLLLAAGLAIDIIYKEND